MIDRKPCIAPLYADTEGHGATADLRVVPPPCALARDEGVLPPAAEVRGPGQPDGRRREPHAGRHGPVQRRKLTPDLLREDRDVAIVGREDDSVALEAVEIARGRQGRRNPP